MGRRDRRILSRWKGWVGGLPGGLLLLVVIVIPCVLLVTYAFRSATFAGVGPGPTFEQFKWVFESESTRRLMLRTLGVSGAVALLGTSLAFAFAYGAAFRMRRRVALIVLGVMLGAGIISFIVRVYSWGTLLGTNGIINSALIELGLIDHPLGFLYFGYFAIIVTMTYVYLPLGVLTMYGALNDIDPRTLQAGRDLGVGRWRTALQVVVPQVRKSLISTFLLIAILASGDYVTPQVVGGTRGQTIGTLIAEQALSTGNVPRAAAIAISFIVLFAVTLLLLAGLWRVTRAPRRVLGGPFNKLSRPVAAKTPGVLARVSLSRLAALIICAYLVIPTVVVVIFSFNSGLTLGLPWEGFTFGWYGDIVGKPGFGEALTNSIEIAVIAVVGSLAIGIPYAFAMKGRNSKATRLMESSALLPWVIPGVLLGLGILIAAESQGLELGVPVTALAHMALDLPVVTIVIFNRLNAMNPELIAAARDLGSSPFRVFRTVTLPMILPSVIGVALMAAAFSLDEILVTTFTIGLENTIPVWLLSQAKLGFNPGINALGVMLMAGTLTAFGLAALVMSGAGMRKRFGGSK